MLAEVDAILTARADRRVARMSIGQAALEAVDKMVAAQKGGDKSAVKLGLRDLDALISGLRPGDLAILPAGPAWARARWQPNFP